MRSAARETHLDSITPEDHGSDTTTGRGMKDDELMEDACFGSDEVMLQWAKANGLTIVKDERGEYDWNAVYQEWLDREDEAEEGEE